MPLQHGGRTKVINRVQIDPEFDKGELEMSVDWTDKIPVVIDEQSLEEIVELADQEPETMNEILRNVKANIAKLDGCKGPHEFALSEPEEGQVVRRYVCSKCGGHVEAIYKLWYEEGLAHGKEIRNGC